MTQANLAQTLGLASHTHITNVEAGRRSPSLDLVLRVVAVFQVPVDSLVNDDVAVDTGARTARDEVLPPPALHEFGAKLRALRLQRNMTQEDLAKAVGLDSHAHVANIESGRRVPSLELVLRSAMLFDVSFEYLLWGSADHQKADPDV
ncbi:MAG: hypothetical protein CYG59_09440 [Chloroflexi bacterium]|nr:MAG: hypothetical protein CYG59_09440 [Chloroflexota bacterium]